jgi:hypothetical protein
MSSSHGRIERKTHLFNVHWRWKESLDLAEVMEDLLDDVRIVFGSRLVENLPTFWHL